VTRPLLFKIVVCVRDGSFNTFSNDTRTFYKNYADACSHHARSSLRTLKFMHQNQLLNNVLWLDAFYILSTGLILLLEYLRSSSVSEARRVNECISILRDLQPRGTGRTVLDSLSDLGTHLGLDDLPTPTESPPYQHQHPGELPLELFSNTPSSAATPGTGISSPEIGMNGMGIGGAYNANAVGDAWMDEVVRMAYAEFGHT